MAPSTPLPQQLDDYEQKRDEEPFVWRDHWYPVSLIEDLDPSVPTAFQLLGRELVVWKDSEGEWRVFLDKCPHRLAPLSMHATLNFGVQVMDFFSAIPRLGLVISLNFAMLH
jgi:phenylpropionate dioxygenase-like ring-hydroxylating dioxygenase large terminal subunit